MRVCLPCVYVCLLCVCMCVCVSQHWRLGDVAVMDDKAMVRTQRGCAHTCPSLNSPIYTHAYACTNALNLSVPHWQHWRLGDAPSDEHLLPAGAS
jgi:hypothetical protein